MEWVGMGIAWQRAAWGARPAARDSSPLLLPWWEKLQHTVMPQFPHLSVGMTVPTGNRGALWLEVTPSAVLL